MKIEIGVLIRKKKVDVISGEIRSELDKKIQPIAQPIHQCLNPKFQVRNSIPS